MHLCQCPRKARWNSTAHIRVVDMADCKTDNFAIVKYRLPQMHIRRVGADVPTVWVVRHANIAVFVVVKYLDDVSVIKAYKPGSAKVGRRRESLPIRCSQPCGEILCLLDEGRMRGAV